jgi:hypothetical protein
MGLFFRNRLAWWGSAIGVGTMLLCQFFVISEVFFIFLYGGAQTLRSAGTIMQSLKTMTLGLPVTLIFATVLAGLCRMRDTLSLSG